MSEDDLWSWDNNQEQQVVESSKVIDLSFKLECRCLPVDHTCDLHRAIAGALPWFTDEPLTGLHLIHVAGSQNGWMRPQKPDEIIYLSRRTRLKIRIPVNRTEDTRTLTGQEFDIAGNIMQIGTATEKPVLSNDILFSRYVAAEHNDDENDFLQPITEQLKAMNIRFRRLLTGKQVKLRSPQGEINTRSLMVADLRPDDSLTLQELGLGDGRRYGCGIFIHHKAIKAVNPDNIGHIPGD